MASSYTGPIRGLYSRHGFFKSVYKGEDTWVQKPGLSTQETDSKEGSVGFDLFGVFDGHGGKQAATYASRHLPETLLEAISSSPEPQLEAEDSPTELRGCKQITEADWREWERQESLAAKLPDAFTRAFSKLQANFLQSTKESGTTATAVALVGWELLVANVGDSCAYIDTGSEVRLVSGNHRLEDNKAEQERIRAKGFEVSPSTLEGKPCGPLRVWPGGLAMGRSIGDYDAGVVVLCEPDVRQVTLPSTGARVVIASDGLWDAVTPKTALHHVRGMPANKAARELVGAALKAKGLKDDITVLVVDAVPGEEHKLPPQLAKDGGGNLQAQSMQLPTAHVHQPLQEADASHAWRQQLWQRRLQAVQAAFPEAFCPSREMSTMESGAFSMESSGTILAETEVPGVGHDDSAEDQQSDAETESSEVPSSGLANNPFMLVGNNLDEDEWGESWETVPSRERSVPQRGRKHALPPSQGSPSEPVQLPKAPREAPPSPAASPMQTSESGGSSRRSSRWSQGRGRLGRGRGRSSWNGPRSAQAEPPRHINGFKVRHDQLVPQSSADDVHFADGLTFLSEGGFSLQPPAMQFGTNPMAAVGGRGAGIVEFTPASGLDAGPLDAGGRKRSGQRATGRGRGRGGYRPRKPDTSVEKAGEHTPEALQGRGRGRRVGRGRRPGAQQVRSGEGEAV